MRRLRLLGAMLLTLAVAAPGAALADPQDFQLYRLGNPATTPDANAQFRTFANQLGVALSSWNLAPPETLGHSGFNFAFEYAVANVDPRPEIWPRQTPGRPTDLLLMPAAHVRKGLPFSFEIGGRLTYLQYSRMTSAMIEGKWALHEGKAIHFAVPDLSVRGYGNRLIGARDFNLTTAGLDFGLGYQIPVGGMLTITPYAGYNLIYVNATSNVIDFDPGRSLANAQTQPTLNTGVFEEVRMFNNHSNRFYGGLRFIAYVFELGAEFSYAQVANTRNVTTFAGKIGIDF
ncbi:MAG: hypothetical protein ACK4N5_24260 [Myxococcales bacterium]